MFNSGAASQWKQLQTVSRTTLPWVFEGRAVVDVIVLSAKEIPFHGLKLVEATASKCCGTGTFFPG